MYTSHTVYTDHLEIFLNISGILNNAYIYIYSLRDKNKKLNIFFFPPTYHLLFS